MTSSAGHEPPVADDANHRRASPLSQQAPSQAVEVCKAGSGHTTAPSNGQSELPTGPSASEPPRPMFTRLSTMPDSRILDHPRTKNRPMSQWTIPRSSTSKSPRAATLFLGQDHERWRMRDRDSMGAGLKLAWGWRSGSSSDLPDASVLESYPYGEDDESTEGDFTDTFTDEESESGQSSSKLSRRSSRSSHRSRTGSGAWKRPCMNALTSATGQTSSDVHKSATPSASSSKMESGSSSQSSNGFLGRRPRRFSSNGPEAAFLRHETVIGIHTPRRDSSSSSLSSASGRQLPAIERVSLAPLSQIKTGTPAPSSRPPSGTSSKVVIPAALQQQQQQIKRELSPSPGSQQKPDLSGVTSRPPKPQRELSSSDLLKKAAAIAAASSVPASPEIDAQTAPPSPLSPKGERGTPSSRHTADSSSRSDSPGPIALRLARRRKPISVEGTLYDRTGPFREGAVTDGLSVRLFSAEHEKEGEGWADSDEDEKAQQTSTATSRSRRPRKTTRRPQEDEDDEKSGKMEAEAANRDKNGSHRDEEAAEGDEAEVPACPLVNRSSAATTYLITTPDNRVSSAAKLRRWAMDGSGKFYAAMEIKSVEAKIRSAMDPNEARENAAYARSLAKILRSTYLDDILTEIQKAETLSTGRAAVAKLLMTSDGKYIRLEEDYPEESFFVIAGCEDEELYPVVALVFVQALAHIHRFHQAGWLHGDIKLENLMFDTKGELVVIDYENANPFRTPGGDETVQLMSFDWVPPEASGSDNDGGRRVGPSADLWALGANLVRAFALRNGIDDSIVRQLILEEQGQKKFLAFRDELIKTGDDNKRATAESVDLGPILETQREAEAEVEGGRALMSPARLLLPFALSAPRLLKYVLASCLVLSPSARGVEAELEGLRLAAELQKERDGDLMRLGTKAVRTAIELSGSEWVRPKLEEARLSLGLGDDEGAGDRSAEESAQ